MAIPAASRWWIATLLIVAVLMAISALALDRPNVVWDAHEPHCPSCRKTVEMHSSRCAHCGTDFDWVVSAPDESPLSDTSLSVLESEWLRARVAELGPDAAAERVATNTDLSKEAALEYLSVVSQGKCGWCGGTRRDLAGAESQEAGECPLCFGSGTSIMCGGDRRTTLGNWAAEKAIQHYEEEMHQLLTADLAVETVRQEARRLAERFLRRFAGTQQAGRIQFWPRVQPGQRGAGGRAASFGRERIRLVLASLRAAE